MPGRTDHFSPPCVLCGYLCVMTTSGGSWSTPAAVPAPRPVGGAPASPTPPPRPVSRPWVLLLTGLIGGIALFAVVGPQLLGAGSRSALDPPVLDGSGGYRFIHVDGGTGLPSRFDPCSPVSYVVNPAAAPPGGVADVQEAFRRAELATGIRFVYEGEVDEVPMRERTAHQPERYGDGWAPILVGWVPMAPDEGERVHGAVVGWAAHAPVRNSRGQDLVTSGTIALDAGARSVNPGFGAGRRWGNVVLHELGHLLGLDHSEHPGEVMHATVDQGAGDWGPGDLAGLVHLGREAGCLRVPAPDRVDMSGTGSVAG